MPKGFTGNQLKLIALLAMTVDHIGVVLFPQHLWLRIVGRLAFPIYGYMIGEGCRYSRSLPRYLMSVAAMALLCQVVTYFATGSLYQCILVTFSLSIGMIMQIEKARKAKRAFRWLLVGLSVAAVWFLTQTFPSLLPGTDYAVDYGFLGVMLPVVVWLLPEKRYALPSVAAVLLLMSIGNWVQIFALGAVALLMLYNGHRGSSRLKGLFYWYYPVHIAAIYLIGMFF